MPGIRIRETGMNSQYILKLLVISFWVYNTENNMQFYAARVFIRKSMDGWFNREGKLV